MGNEILFLYGLVVMCYAGRLYKTGSCKRGTPSQAHNGSAPVSFWSNSSKTSLQLDRLTSANGGTKRHEK
jgi:hypothetical protein